MIDRHVISRQWKAHLCGLRLLVPTEPALRLATSIILCKNPRTVKMKGSFCFFCFSYRCYCFAIISTLRPPPLHQQWKGLAHGLDCQQQQQTNKRPEMDCPGDRSWPFELTSESAAVPVHDVQDRQRYRPTQPSFDGLID